VIFSAEAVADKVLESHGDKSNDENASSSSKKNNSDEFEIEAENIFFDNIKKQIIANGNVKVQNSKYSISADKFTYDTQNKVIEVEGDVITKDLEMNGIYFAQKAFFDLKNKKMLMSGVRGNLRNARLAAKNIKSETEGVYTSEMITASLCNSCKDGKQISPLWQLRARRLKADIKSNDEVKLRGVYLDIFEKQVLYIPYFSIPAFWTGGKTGFLIPKFKYNKDIDGQLQIPFYWAPAKNIDFTFLPTISKDPMYGLEMRHRLKKGGYEFSINTAKLPFLQNMENYDNSSLFRAWPADIKIQANFLNSFENDVCSLNRKVYELGLDGEIGLGKKPILLYKYDISDKKILVGRAYSNLVYDEYFTSVNAIHFHDLSDERRLISLPRGEFWSIKQINLPSALNNIFSRNPIFVSHISFNSLHNETFVDSISDVAGEVKTLFTTNLGDYNKITYKPAVLFHKMTTIGNRVYNTSRRFIKPSFDVHWHSNAMKDFEPHILVRLEPKQQPFYSVDERQISDEFDDTTLSIYSTTSNLNPNNIFSDGLYSTGLRSINFRSGSHIDYGFILGQYEFQNRSFIKKINLTVGARDYLNGSTTFNDQFSKNGDMMAASLSNKYKEKYVVQLNFERDDIFFHNKTWFTSHMKLSNNESYFDKKFHRLSTSLKYLFFNKEFFFYKSKKTSYNKLLKTEMKYQFNDNVTGRIQNSFKFGEDAMGNKISKAKDMKFNLEYVNECAIIGLSMKKGFGKKDLNDKATTYKLYFKIPQIR
jgi:hypothetical protein